LKLFFIWFPRSSVGTKPDKSAPKINFRHHAGAW
jgi:hypothetical protein